MKILLAAGVLALGGILFWENGRKQEAQLLRAQLTEAEIRLSAQTSELQALRKEAAEQRRDLAELFRLRAEISQLRQTARQAAAVSPLSTAPNRPAEPKQIMVDTRFVELKPELAAKGAQLGRLPENLAGFAEILSPADMSSLMDEATHSTGVDLLTAPKVTTLDGREAQISITETHTVNGEQVEVGPSLGVFPVLSKDASSVTLTTHARYSAFSAPVSGVATDPRGELRVRSGERTAVVPAGHSLLIGLSDVQPEAPKDGRRLFVLVTPSIVSADGRQ